MFINIVDSNYCRMNINNKDLQIIESSLNYQTLS